MILILPPAFWFFMALASLLILGAFLILAFEEMGSNFGKILFIAFFLGAAFLAFWTLANGGAR